MRNIIYLATLATLAIGCKEGKEEKDDTTALAKPAAAAAATEHAADSIGNAGVPKAVADVGTHGEDLYDHVKATDWTKANASLDSLDVAAKGLSAAEASQLASVLDSLHKAVAAHQRATALEAANQVTFVGAKLTEAYHPKMPADIVRLDYYGRELEIWATRKDMAKLAATSDALRKTWESVKGTVVSAGGGAAATTTDSLVTKLGAAKSAADYAKLATPILDVVDLLEKPFEK
jgi:hypothetical protein